MLPSIFVMLWTQLEKQVGKQDRYDRICLSRFSCRDNLCATRWQHARGIGKSEQSSQLHPPKIAANQVTTTGALRQTLININKLIKILGKL